MQVVKANTCQVHHGRGKLLDHDNDSISTHPIPINMDKMPADHSSMAPDFCLTIQSTTSLLHAEAHRPILCDVLAVMMAEQIMTDLQLFVPAGILTSWQLQDL